MICLVLVKLFMLIIFFVLIMMLKVFLIEVIRDMWVIEF